MRIATRVPVPSAHMPAPVRRAFCHRVAEVIQRMFSVQAEVEKNLQASAGADSLEQWSTQNNEMLPSKHDVAGAKQAVLRLFRLYKKYGSCAF